MATPGSFTVASIARGGVDLQRRVTSGRGA